MASSLKEFSTTAGSNTTVGSANIAENCAPSGLNNAQREIIAYTVDYFMNADSIASATTTDLGTKTTNYLEITGTTTITGLGTPTNKLEYTVRFAGILTLTHNATSLILPGGANITTAAGDVAKFKHEGSGNWRCVSYQKASGAAVVSFSKTDITGQTALTTPDHAADYLLLSDTSDSGNLKKVLPKYISPIVARYSAEYATNADFTATTIPIDDTIPLIGEGAEVITVNVTTTTATQRVRVRFSGFLSTTSSTTLLVFAMFRASTCIQVSIARCEYDVQKEVFFEVEVAPGAAATEAYSVRMGNPNTVRFNGTTAARLFGGAAKTTLIAEVIEP